MIRRLKPLPAILSVYFLVSLRWQSVSTSGGHPEVTLACVSNFGLAFISLGVFFYSKSCCAFYLCIAEKGKTKEKITYGNIFFLHSQYRLQYPEERMTCRLVAFIFVGMGLGHNCPFTGHAELGKDLRPLPINLHLGSSWHMPEPKLRPT